MASVPVLESSSTATTPGGGGGAGPGFCERMFAYLTSPGPLDASSNPIYNLHTTTCLLVLLTLDGATLLAAIVVSVASVAFDPTVFNAINVILPAICVPVLILAIFGLSSLRTILLIVYAIKNVLFVIGALSLSVWALYQEPKDVGSAVLWLTLTAPYGVGCYLTFYYIRYRRRVEALDTNKEIKNEQ